jgi:hypothetical protein
VDGAHGGDLDPADVEALAHAQLGRPPEPEAPQEAAGAAGDHDGRLGAEAA